MADSYRSSPRGGGEAPFGARQKLLTSPSRVDGQPEDLLGLVDEWIDNLQGVPVEGDTAITPLPASDWGTRCGCLVDFTWGVMMPAIIR